MRLADRLAGRAQQRARWLFLTPEMECLAPGLLAALAPSAGERAGVEDEERRLDRLVRAGTAAEWFAELRRHRALLEAAAAGGAPPPLVQRLALVLLEQYLLAPTVLDPVPGEVEEVRRLRGLAHPDAAPRVASHP